MSNPYISLIKTAWRYARNEKKLYIITYTLFILASIVFAMYPLLYGWFVNALQKEAGKGLYYTWIYAGAYFGLKLVEWGFHGPARIIERKLAFNFSRNFLQERYHQALHLPLKWHQDHHSGATINRIRKAYEALKEFFQNGFMYLYALTKFIFSLIAILAFSPLFGGIAVAIGMAAVWVVFTFDKPFIKAVDETNEKEHIVSGALFDSLSNIITVVTLRLEKQMEKSLMKKIKDVFAPFLRTVRINELKWFIADMLVALIYVTTVLGYIYQHYEPGKTFPIGNLVALLGFVTQFTSVFHDVAWQYTNIVQFNTDIRTASSIPEAYDRQHLPDNVDDLPAHWKSISISGLNFSHKDSYSSEEKAHSLHNIAIHLQQGKRIALIGESGSGKSTLMAVLRGLYPPEPGASFIIDHETPVKAESITQRITLFPQEPEIFESTIEHNITLGLPFEPEDTLQVCRIAQFSEVIDHLPKGLQSNMQEKGVNLSGGQKQRLALARGILAARDSDIVLLDEPTSSIDPKTEILIYERLFEEWKDKVIVSSLHRLYLLNHFDYIYVMRDGYIVDEGDLEWLKKNSAGFQELWRHQEDKTRFSE